LLLYGFQAEHVNPQAPTHVPSALQVRVLFPSIDNEFLHVKVHVSPTELPEHDMVELGNVLLISEQ